MEGFGVVFLAKRERADIVAGAPWEEVLYHSLRCCRVVRTLCSSRSNASRWWFAEARAQADCPLAHTAQNYYALDVKGLALCGLVLCGERKNLPAAIEAYQAARAINKDAGVVGRFLRLLHPDSTSHARLPQTDWPLRIVVAISNPSNLPRYNLAPVDVDLEL